MKVNLQRIALTLFLFGSVPAIPDTGVSSAFTLMGEGILPGTFKRLELVIGENFTGDELPIPVFVAHGNRKGPVLCLTAGIHGDEVNGIEIVRRQIRGTRLSELNGTIIGIPIVNMPAFIRGMRYLPDRRDLNRYFPGRSKGSSASRIAFAIFERVIRKCEYLVDYHTGSLKRTNQPQVRGDFKDARIKQMAEAFGAPVAISKSGGFGTLRWAAVRAGIPAIIFEAGGPTRFDEKKIAEGLVGTIRLMNWLGMTSEKLSDSQPPVFFDYTYWVRAEKGGIMLTSVRLGQKVGAGEKLARIVDPFKDSAEDVRAARAGQVIGMAYNQVVMPGFALFHIGTNTPIPSSQADSTGPEEPGPDDEQAPPTEPVE